MRQPSTPAALRRGPLILIGGETTRILVEQMTAVSTERLGESAGRLSAHELRAVDEALVVVLCL